ncbi:DUF6538 domain-containing protein [Pseudomonas helleri]|uniref:DUF6538 domain-containing protein n=1 Tax=Pseudomonas helleri TaxID=1608996 RepID=A0A6G1WAZ2_9PSED|nr:MULTISPECIES: DUF6538 domain-containing protein [Pseudomonas]MQT28179.1 hypothetical protein [Pseudomonas helleri]MQU16292.1 hypothetical protein [Pseudomonas helleri]NMY75337.1 hypothetical protein [Pseudomonas sp. WS 5071]
MSYLTRRDGRYSYRRRFPADVADVVGRVEYRKALGTADRGEALKLAHLVSVEFDRICNEALAARSDPALPTPETTSAQTAVDVLNNLNAVVRGFTINITERMQSSGWQSELKWRRANLEALANGAVLPGLDIHPVTALAMRKALDETLAGNPPRLDSTPLEGTEKTVPTAASDHAGTVTEAVFQAVLDEYCEDVSKGRADKVISLSKKVLTWPSTQDRQIQSLMQFCAEKLAGGGKASSVHSDAYCLLSVLKRIPGWAGMALPKAGSVAKAIRSGAGMGQDQRLPIPLAQLLAVHAKIKAATPVHYPAAVLLARYALRPSELLQEDLRALSHRVDVLGKSELVFKAALSGGKNAASRRDLPVHAEDEPLFRAVLTGLGLPAGASSTEHDKRVRQRVRSLSRVFRNALGEAPGMSLYSQRHTCADLLRAVHATTDEVGGILGHTPVGSKATSIYGGSQPLDRPRELLAKVRELIPDA